MIAVDDDGDLSERPDALLVHLRIGGRNHHHPRLAVPGAHEALDLIAILIGAVLSATLAVPALVIASTAAFLLSELADLFVYTPLQPRRLILAVVASGAVGLVVDSIVLLWLAFGSLDFLGGQILGKAWILLLTLPVIAWIRRRDKRLGLQPA